MRRLLAFLLFAVSCLSATLPAQAQDLPAEQLQTWEANLSAIQKELADNPDLAQDRYDQILRSVTKLIVDARALSSAQQDQSQPIRSQLASLGAPPAEGQPLRWKICHRRSATN